MLSEKINQYLKDSYLRFHCPAHSGSKYFADMTDIVQETLARDLSEVDGLDDLQNPKAVLKDSQDFIADLFAAEQSFFLTAGASEGMRVALMALKIALADHKSEKSKILIARNVHKSVFAALILTGFDFEIFDPIWNEDLGIYTHIDFAAVTKDFDLNSFAAMLMTNPTYEGFYSQIPQELLDLDLELIVDEAHGAHYYFADSLASPPAVAIRVQSWHKCLGSLTQTGVLHLAKSKIIKPCHVRQALAILQTTSPSYLLLESMCKVAESLAKDATALVEEKLAMSTNYVIAKEYPNDDPLRKIIRYKASSGYVSGELLDEIFTQQKVMFESVLPNSVLAFINLGTSEKEMQELSCAAKKVSEQLEGIAVSTKTLYKPKSSKQLKNIAEAYFAAKKPFPVQEAVGKISGELYAPCPPGIALLLPGQEISQELCDYLLEIDAQKEILCLI